MTTTKSKQVDKKTLATLGELKVLGCNRANDQIMQFITDKGIIDMYYNLTDGLHTLWIEIIGTRIDDNGEQYDIIKYHRTPITMEKIQTIL